MSEGKNEIDLTEAELGDFLLKFKRAYERDFNRNYENNNEKTFIKLFEMISDVYDQVKGSYDNFHNDVIVFSSILFETYYQIYNCNSNVSDSWLIYSLYFTDIKNYIKLYKQSTNIDGGIFKPSSKEKIINSLIYDKNSLLRKIENQKSEGGNLIRGFTHLYKEWFDGNHSYEDIKEKYQSKLLYVNTTLDKIFKPVNGRKYNINDLLNLIKNDESQYSLLTNNIINSRKDLVMFLSQCYFVGKLFESMKEYENKELLKKELL